MTRRMVCAALTATALLGALGTTVCAEYLPPAGGWTYIYTGNAAAPGAGGGAWDALDGTWVHTSYGNSAWDGSGLGADGKPGGAQVLTDLVETDVQFLRVQDPGDPRDHGFGGDPSNRKIAFAHDITAEGASDTIVDDGVTLTFRTRLSTAATGSIDPQYPDTGSGGENSGVPGGTAWQAGGNGLFIHDAAKDNFHIKQASGPASIAFALGLTSDHSEYAGGGGLIMNHLNGTSPTGDVDAGEGGTPTILSIPDAQLTQWHEFWITIQGDTSGGGTHRVDVYMDGSLTPQTFHVTAGDQNDFGGTSFIAFGAGATPQQTAIDVDFFGWKGGAVAPIPEPGTFVLLAMAGLGLLIWRRR